MNPKLITVYEHQILKLNTVSTRGYLKHLEEFYGDGCPYFDLIHEGVKFKEYVGVLQIDDLTIEVLPKTDKNTKNNEEEKWRGVLIEMLKQSGVLKVTAPSTANLKLRRNHILDLYFELFLNEVERLLHEGLIKRYRRKEENLHSLKGKLLTSKNVQHNAIHKERFYCEYTVYDMHHVINKILYKTLLLLKKINSSPSLVSRIGNLLLNFPEMDDLKVTDSTFNKILYDRKTQRYKEALNIAELLLLNYHPDVQTGRKHVLALMFDMNLLWEKYVFNQLYPLTKKGFKINEQVGKHFWGIRNKRNIIPDIVVKHDNETFILDTKWKVIEDAKPSMDDIQQMFAYNMVFAATKSILLYPKVNHTTIAPEPFIPKLNSGKESYCQVTFVEVIKDGKLNSQISEDIFRLLSA